MLRRGGAGRAERAVSDDDVKMKGAGTMGNSGKRERQARPGANAADWMLVRLRANVERAARLGKRIEERRRRMRDFRQQINAMRWAELVNERRRLRARQRRERGRGSDGLEMVNFRLKLLEARMREVARQKMAPGR